LIHFYKRIINEMKWWLPLLSIYPVR